MIEFTLWDIVRNLLLAARWTVMLSLVAFVGGGIVGLLILLLRISANNALRRFASGYIGLFQGTPLLMQLFLMFFGLPMLGFRIEPWSAAVLGLTFFASAYLAEIWRSGVDALPRGQWDAGASLGLHYHPGAPADHPAAGFPHRVGADGRLSRAAHQEHRADLDHRFRRAAADLQRDQQCDVRAVHGLRPGGADLLRLVLSAHAICAGAGAAHAGPLNAPIETGAAQ